MLGRLSIVTLFFQSGRMGEFSQDHLKMIVKDLLLILPRKSYFLEMGAEALYNIFQFVISVSFFLTQVIQRIV